MATERTPLVRMLLKGCWLGCRSAFLPGPPHLKSKGVLPTQQFAAVHAHYSEDT